MKKHLVFVGGGHAHLTALLGAATFVNRGHRVTLISPGPYHYYSGMGPGLLSGIYRPADVRFNVERLSEDRGATFVLGTVVRVDPQRRVLFLSSGDEIEYDLVSFNIGSHVALKSITSSEKNVFMVKPIENLLKAQRVIQELLHTGEPRILVIGGGPAGLELGGNAWRLVHDQGASARITLLGGRKFLSRFPQKVRQLAMASLTSRGIELVEGSYVKGLESGGAFLEDGREFPADIIVLAWGIEPPAIFRESKLPVGPDGGLLVNSYLQSVRYPEIFGGGDCISLRGHPLDKVGVYPVRQNPILYHNLLAALTGGSLKHFHAGRNYLLIFNLGNGRGIFRRKNWVWEGRLAFYLKDYIDRKFMRRFQVSGEQSER